MRFRIRPRVGSLAVLLLAAPSLGTGHLLGPRHLLGAQHFEGVVRMRSITVSVEALEDLVAGGAGLEQVPGPQPPSLAGAPDEGASDSLIAAFGVNPRAAFDLPVSRILALEGAGGSEVEVTESRLYFKGSRFRADAGPEEESGPYMIMDIERDVIWTVTPAQGRYVEWQLADVSALNEFFRRLREDEAEGEKAETGGEKDAGGEGGVRAAADRGPAGSARLEVRPLDLGQPINGIAATAYEVVAPGEISRAWISRDYEDLLAVFRLLVEKRRQLDFFAEGEEENLLVRMTEYGLPVRVQTLDGWRADGSELYRIEEILSVERVAVSGSLFEVPSGYQKTSLRDLMERPPERPPEGS
ncbi:MAG: hypothetical protein ACE5JR_10575 [Gemmatimonadota bacterium]